MRTRAMLGRGGAVAEGKPMRGAGKVGVGWSGCGGPCTVVSRLPDHPLPPSGAGAWKESGVLSPTFLYCLRGKIPTSPSGNTHLG